MTPFVLAYLDSLDLPNVSAAVSWVGDDLAEGRPMAAISSRSLAIWRAAEHHRKARQ